MVTYDAWFLLDATGEKIEAAFENEPRVFVLMRNGDIFESWPERIDDYYVWLTDNGLLVHGDENPIGWLPRDALPPPPVRK